MPFSPSFPRIRRLQAGFTLVEALFSVLIFAIGLLGLVKVNATAVSQATGAEFRTTAAMLAEDLIARMWLSDRTAATLQASYADSGGGAGYTAWKAKVTASGLPGTAANPPKVTITSPSTGNVSVTASSLATITISWQAPGDTAVHKYVATAQLK